MISPREMLGVGWGSPAAPHPKTGPCFTICSRFRMMKRAEPFWAQSSRLLCQSWLSWDTQ